MAKRWSKFQYQINNLFDQKINMQVRCSIYRMNSQYGSTDLPRYWITLDKDIIFDYPKQFVKVGYPYVTDVNDISNLIREYIDTPVTDLLNYTSASDHWDLINILKAGDRRIGKKKLKKYFQNNKSVAIKKILHARKI